MARRRTAAKKTSSGARKAAAKKTGGARKSAAKKTTARKSTASRKTSSARKAGAKRATTKRTTTKKSGAKKSGAKRATAKRATAKKSSAKRSTARRKTSAARAPRRLELGSLRDVLMDQLAVLRDAERQLVQALPKVAAAATHPRLREAIEHHHEETRRQAQRLDTIFSRVGGRAPSGSDDVMTALVADAERFVEARGDDASRDAALIGAAQRVEHHEIAAYGTARTLADELGLDEVRDLLNETLDEESNADTLLTQIATGGFFRTGVNEAAANS